MTAGPARRARRLTTFADLNTVLDGTTAELSSPTMVSPQAGETVLALETVTDTEPSEIKSPKASKQQKLPEFYIYGTKCCGQHVLSGWQQYRDPDPETYLLGILACYKRNAARNERIQRENDAASQRYWASSDEARRKPMQHPHPHPENTPGHIAGMLVMTWNDSAYLSGAKRFQEFIKSRGLGECMITGTVRNPNSGHDIQCMVWNVDAQGWKKFIEHEG